MSILMDNQVLQAAEAKIEGGLQPQMKEYYNRVVIAGMRAVLKDGANGPLGALKASQNPLKDAAEGALNLVFVLREKSRNTMPEGALVPGAFTLMLKALDTLDRAGVMHVGANELIQATHIFANRLFTMTKLTPKKFGFIADKVHGVMGDHAQMDMISRRAGTVRDPRASIPTPITDPTKGGNDDGV